MSTGVCLAGGFRKGEQTVSDVYMLRVLSSLIIVFIVIFDRTEQCHYDAINAFNVAAHGMPGPGTAMLPTTTRLRPIQVTLA